MFRGYFFRSFLRGALRFAPVCACSMLAAAKDDFVGSFAESRRLQCQLDAIQRFEHEWVGDDSQVRIIYFSESGQAYSVAYDVEGTKLRQRFRPKWTIFTQEVTMPTLTFLQKTFLRGHSKYKIFGARGKKRQPKRPLQKDIAEAREQLCLGDVSNFKHKFVAKSLEDFLALSACLQSEDLERVFFQDYWTQDNQWKQLDKKVLLNMIPRTKSVEGEDIDSDVFQNKVCAKGHRSKIFLIVKGGSVLEGTLVPYKRGHIRCLSGRSFASAWSGKTFVSSSNWFYHDMVQDTLKSSS